MRIVNISLLLVLFLIPYLGLYSEDACCNDCPCTCVSSQDCTCECAETEFTPSEPGYLTFEVYTLEVYARIKYRTRECNGITEYQIVEYEFFGTSTDFDEAEVGYVNDILLHEFISAVVLPFDPNNPPPQFRWRIYQKACWEKIQNQSPSGPEDFTYKYLPCEDSECCTIEVFGHGDPLECDFGYNKHHFADIVQCPPGTMGDCEFVCKLFLINYRKR